MKHFRFVTFLFALTLGVPCASIALGAEKPVKKNVKLDFEGEVLERYNRGPGAALDQLDTMSVQDKNGHQSGLIKKKTEFHEELNQSMHELDDLP